jgi:hypothetical protein
MEVDGPGALAASPSMNLKSASAAATPVPNGAAPVALACTVPPVISSSSAGPSRSEVDARRPWVVKDAIKSLGVASWPS